ncbi:hypothetical protein GFS24_01840 [Chitinophaga sp. SYP-B3965]|uniref:hypothetical protein n=1 Tax=Chitinophaga sp. SYP-B3965 TaxID=2663120 RepID=UPI0012995DC2|nr:hypothetical protein [Chitinophaga sp. SYP-B3965]MRG43833.1 hypothetical protein [Chitinophaga sp. SYP-B3965]
MQVRDISRIKYEPQLIQANHWLAAAKRLEDLDALASELAWKSLEQYVHPHLRQHLSICVKKLVEKGEAMRQRLHTGTATAYEIERFKRSYLQVETLMDFYADALATRTNPATTATLKACDYIAEHSMRTLLEPLGHTTPAVITYIDKGMGASILKAGLRLWDDSENPAAAIKIVRHNLLRPTALIHEAGHQVAHITGWNEQLSAALRKALLKYGVDFAESWAAWSSEIAADIFAFVHTGFASVAALHDVVDGPSRGVLHYSPGDPHPISFLRVLVGTECCRQRFGNGIWDHMRHNWMRRHPLENARPKTAALVRASIPLLPEIVKVLLDYPLRAFQGKSISQQIDVNAVHPASLQRTADLYGNSFYTSAPLLLKAPLIRLAWNGYQLIAEPAQAEQFQDQQRSWMQLLGTSIK